MGGGEGLEGEVREWRERERGREGWRDHERGRGNIDIYREGRKEM